MYTCILLRPKVSRFILSNLELLPYRWTWCMLPVLSWVPRAHLFLSFMRVIPVILVHVLCCVCKFSFMLLLSLVYFLYRSSNLGFADFYLLHSKSSKITDITIVFSMCVCLQLTVKNAQLWSTFIQMKDCLIPWTSFLVFLVYSIPEM